LTEVGLIAAIYAVVTIAIAPLGYGPVQFRATEALTLLPMLTPMGVYGVTLGCAISNAAGVAMGQTVLPDVIIGTAATLIAAVITRIFRNKTRVFSVSVVSLLAPVLVNAVMVGAELSYFFSADTFWECALSVGAGELAVVCLLGIPLLLTLRRTKLFDMYK
jgi:uncharacterized membrane protein